MKTSIRIEHRFRAYVCPIISSQWTVFSVKTVKYVKQVKLFKINTRLNILAGLNMLLFSSTIAFIDNKILPL